MTSFVNLQDFLDPGDDLVGGWVRGLVEVDDTVLLQDVDGTVRGGVTARERSEVGSFHIEFVKVLEEKGPGAGINASYAFLWFDLEFSVDHLYIL